MPGVRAAPPTTAAALAAAAAALVVAAAATAVFSSSRRTQQIEQQREKRGKDEEEDASGAAAAALAAEEIGAGGFRDAAGFVQGFPDAVGEALRSRPNAGQADGLRLYALFRQTTDGPADPSRRPSLLPASSSSSSFGFGFLRSLAAAAASPASVGAQIVARRKFDAWAALADTPRAEAGRQYAALVSQLCPEWEAAWAERTAGLGRSSEQMMGVVASTGMELTADEKAFQDRVDARQQAEQAEPQGGEGDAAGAASVVAASGDALLAAVEAGDVNGVQALLDGAGEEDDGASRALANCTRPAGDSALHLAVDGEHVDVVRLLLERGADPNARDADEMTPLHVAGLVESAILSKMLREHGADATLEDAGGDTPDLIDG
jgi:acyl-CoA-binding protein